MIIVVVIIIAVVVIAVDIKVCRQWSPGAPSVSPVSSVRTGSLDSLLASARC